jgi:hypothetical protein
MSRIAITAAAFGAIAAMLRRLAASPATSTA